MHVERFKRLIEVSKEIPLADFDMRGWGFTDFCGTKACLAGHAAMDSELRQQGLHLEWPKGPEEEASIEFGDYSSFEAITVFFGISAQDAYKLFSEHAKDEDDVDEPFQLKSLSEQKEFYVNRLVEYFEANQNAQATI